MQNAETNGLTSGTYVRGSCTDSTWRSSSGPNFCISSDPSGGAGMGKCPDTDPDMYYCEDSNVASVNCSAQENVITFPGTASVLTTIGVAASSTSKPATSSTTPILISSSAPGSTSSSIASTTISDSSTSSSTTSPTTSTALSSPTNHSDSDNSVTIGVGVGVGVGIGVLVLGLGAFIMNRRRKRSQTGDKYEVEVPYRQTHQEEAIYLNELPVENTGSQAIELPVLH